MSIRKHGEILAGQNSINIRTDAELDPVSENPIQNRAVVEGLNQKQDIKSEVVVVNGNSMTVVPGKAYKWNVTGDGVLTFSGTPDKYETVPVYINLAEGAAVTAQGVSVPHEITSSGWYEIKWDGTGGTLEKTNSAEASDIEDSTRHQSVQETLDDLQNKKVGKPENFTEGDLMEFDENGDALDSGINKKTVVMHPGSYDDLHSGTAGNLVDDRAPSTNRKFGFDTACGDVSISDDGTADPTLLKGTTYVKNQLVGDSKVVKELGQGVVTSPVAVEGDIDHAYIKGRSLVRNQLVPASMVVERSSTNGSLAITDAVSGDALALKMVAPRSVVVNQHMNWSANVTAISGSTYMTISKDTTNQTLGMEVLIPTNANGFRVAISLPRQHILAVHGIVTASSYGFTSQIGVASRGTVAQKYISQSNNTLFGKISINNDADTSNLFIYASFLQAQPAGWTYSIKDLTVVDLTQYFNGDQTLIDSITSWDDLVAYDPRFASYVEYNTGTVTGVQPSVKVTGKNLLNTNRQQGNITGWVNNQSEKRDFDCTKYYVGLMLNGNNFMPQYVSNVSVGEGTCSVKSSSFGVSFPYQVKPGESYRLAFSCELSSNVYVVYYRKDGSLYDASTISAIGTSKYVTFTIPTDVYVMCLNFGGSNNELRTYTDISLTFGSTATSYEPYHDGGTAQAPELFAVGNAADEFEAVSGVTTRKMASVDLGTLGWTDYYDVETSHPYGYCVASLSSKEQGTSNVITAQYRTLYTYSTDKTIHGSSNKNVYLVDSSLTGKTASQIREALSGQLLYYELAAPTTSASTPTQISLQAGNNVAMQTDGGRTISSIALGYDGTSFDVPLKTGRSYLVKKGSTSTLVTDGTTQSVTGGQDMIVDLNMLYNGVPSLITPIADWNALVSDTGMYGSYTAYDEGTVVHSDQTEVKVTGKNLWEFGNRTISESASVALTSVLPAGTYTMSALVTSTDTDSSKCLFYWQYVGSSSTGSVAITRNTRASVLCVFAHPVNRIGFRSGQSHQTSTGDTSTWTNIQLELGSTATAYEPYYSGGTATAGLLKGVPGSVYDQLDAVTGNVTTRIGSYTFTGNENWTVGTVYANSFTCSNGITNAYRLPYTNTPTYMTAGYTAVGSITNSTQDLSFCINTTAHATNTIIFKDSSCATLDDFKAKITGKTVYYRLATYTKSTTTPQPLTQPTGGLTVLQTAGTLPVPLDVRHAVSEWDEPIVRNCKYIFRDNGVDSLVTGSTTVTYKHVVGSEHKLINLTQWFGRNREPSVADFYKLFPTWKDADIPYDRGTILNYKGTGVRTIGFNAYNHATGTAVLLGGNKYQICGTYTSCTYTDQWGNAEELSIDDKGIFTPTNNGTLTVVGGNDTDTCVHLCWSGYKDYGKPDYEWFPYEEKGVEWDLSQWFPDGMNGIGTVQDEMTNNSSTRRFGIIDLGTLDWNKNATSGNFSAMVSSMDDATGRSTTIVPDILCEGYPVVNYVSGASTTVTDGCMTRNNASGSGRNILVHDSNYDTADEFKEAVSGIVLIYPLATPVTSEIAPTQNFSYPVNGFGTEQSLPINTLTLLTTDLDADIRYSLDFTRTVANYSKIEDKVKQLVDEEDNLARQDGNYGDKGGVFNYATQLLDPNAPPTEASYGNRTAAGDVSIADNGTADVTSLQGTTQIQNQLVHDTNMNSKSSVDGRLVLTDAVGGQLSRLEIHGGCVVHNQLVKESVEKTATGTGRLGVEDGVAGNAKSLVMTAPRSVVMNQLVQNGDFASTANWSPRPGINSVTVSGNVMTMTHNSDNTSKVLTSRQENASLSDMAGHVVLVVVDIKLDLAAASTISGTWFVGGYIGGGTTQWFSSDESVTGSFAWRSVSSRITLAANANGIHVGIYPSENAILNGELSVSVRNCRLIDLTAYFNGDQTLIDSISTWDDLVAYDSTFASYVPYDTGTVKGVQPTVKVNHTTNVACPVELFGVYHENSYTTYALDNFDAVGGVLNKIVGVVDLGTLPWSAYAEPTDSKPVGETHMSLSGKAKGRANLIVADYLTDETNVDKTIHGAAGTNYVEIHDSSLQGKTPDQIATALSGKFLYYELSTPTTSQYNGTTIPTVDIYNTALQTAGTRSCTLSLTYDGKDQTIALNPSHTYVFNDNQEDDSVITGQSSIEAVGGEDQLVDITQLYNGDATKIANIHSWASLSTRFHRYRDFLPYNPGTVEPDCPVIRKFDNEHAYGIIYDPSQNTPACQWVELNNGVLTEASSFSDFKETPCHQLQRCVMDDLANRHIAYYLDDEDSDKKYNGTRNGVTSDGSASVLTGADGDVMSRIPVGYWDLDEDWQGTGKYLWLISDRPFMGSYYPAEPHDFFYVSPDGGTLREQYVGSYRASICDENGLPLNTTEGALAQTTGTATTNKARSVAGALPYVNVTLNDLTVKSGRNGGSSVNVKFHQWLFLLMAIESGTLDNQAISYGYAGGIQNAFCFWRKSGRVNAGNGTDSITAVENTQDMDNFQKFTVGSTTVQRDTNMDADGRYAWSIYNRNASSTRYFTSSPTPSNGDPVYTASTGTTTAGTVASYAIQSNRTIQFQYRGIENPFGEVWEFEHGIQKFQMGELKSFRGSDNIIYTRDPADDGVSSRAWKNPSEEVFWTTTGSLTTSTFLYSDSSLTTATTVKYKDQPVYRYSSEGYWETLATGDYTMTDQRTVANPVYTVRHNHWPLFGWDTKFDPITFFMRKTGSPGASGRYLPDYWYNDGSVGSRVSFVGGNATYGSYDGLGYRNVNSGLTYSYVSFGGRVSA